MGRSGDGISDRFRRCSVDDSRIRSKTVPFSFENGLVWTGPKKTTTAAATSRNKSFNEQIAVHVRCNSWYISLPSSAKQQREMTKFCVV